MNELSKLIQNIVLLHHNRGTTQHYIEHLEKQNNVFISTYNMMTFIHMLLCVILCKYSKYPVGFVNLEHREGPRHHFLFRIFPEADDICTAW